MDRTKIRWNGWGWAAHEEDAGDWDWLASELGMPALLATPARALEDIALAPPRLAPAQRARLVDILGVERVRDDAFERAAHALGRSYHDLLRLRSGEFPAPDAVLYPRSAEEVLAILRFAAEEGIAVVPFGGGTGVVGGASAAAGPFGSVVTVDLCGMDRLIAVDTVSGTATAEAGITGPVLENHLRARGLTLGHHPQSFEFSTLGGWIAHAGAGRESGRYGAARDWLAGATLATPQGLLETGGPPASAAGPDLGALVLGSEGIFGIITAATVRVRALPAARESRLYLFRDFASGIAALRVAAREAIPATMLRLSDAAETRFHRRVAGREAGTLGWLRDIRLRLGRFDDHAAALTAGFVGNPDEIARARRALDDLAAKLGARALGPDNSALETDARAPHWRDAALNHGLGVDTFETAASWAKLPTLYTAVRAALEDAMRETAPRPGAHGIVLCHIGHSHPDGASLCFTALFARALGNEIAQWQKTKRAASEAILAQGGTISHHHGVGEDHLPWIAREKGDLGIEILRAVKRTLDPKGILNPGKLIPPG